MLEQPTVKCPSCESDIRAADESGLVNVLQEHLYEESTPWTCQARGCERTSRPAERFRRLQRPSHQRGLKAYSSS